MKLTVKLPWDILTTLTTSPPPYGTSLSTKTPGGDLKNRWSLDNLPDVES